jgi:hypothetical protein
MIYTTDEYGAVGIAVSRLVGFTTIFVSVFYVESWVFGSVQYKFWLKTGTSLIAAALAAGLTEYFVGIATGINWPGFVAASVSGMIVYVIVLVILGFVSKEEKEWVLQAVGR